MYISKQVLTLMAIQRWIEKKKKGDYGESSPLEPLYRYSFSLITLPTNMHVLDIVKRIKLSSHVHCIH